jgi:hypothetical protein
MSYTQQESKYVKLTDGKIVPRYLLKRKETNLRQGGHSDFQYEVDEEKLLRTMLDFSGVDI